MGRGAGTKGCEWVFDRFRIWEARALGAGGGGVFAPYRRGVVGVSPLPSDVLVALRVSRRGGRDGGKIVTTLVEAEGAMPGRRVPVALLSSGVCATNELSAPIVPLYDG